MLGSIPNKFSLAAHLILTISNGLNQSPYQLHSIDREMSQREIKGLALGLANLRSPLCHQVLLLLCGVGYNQLSAHMLSLTA